ncbi:MAG: SAM-dependent chlorinase/fluorinase [Bacteroidota bacterium]
MKFITLTTDFGVQSQGVGIMEALILSIAPDVKVIHLMHGLPSYNIVAAARTMETIKYIPIGIHVCVCDPGVGTQRKAIAIKISRGDFLIGPDNGVLLSAAQIMGGIISAHEILNEKYMNHPVSPIFHGRDIFAPAAAYLSIGENIENFGPELQIKNLTKGPYDEAYFVKNEIIASVIQINKFGSLHLNILHETWDNSGIRVGDKIQFIDVKTDVSLELKVCNKFGDVEQGANLILKDDYGRIEIAKNYSSFSEEYKINVGAIIKLIIH